MQMKLLKTLYGRHDSLLRAIGAGAGAGRRNFAAASTEEYLKRNYAKNISEYNSVIGSISAQRRHYLLRDVYDDLVLDGVKPERDTFHGLIIGTMRGSRLQDAIFFRDEMKAMGLVLDVSLYNFLISTCGKCNNSELAIRILEEMKRYEVKPNGQTYICLLSTCAASGRLDRVRAIVRDMTAAGLGLNKFCYAGLITAHKNNIPTNDDAASKIIELVEQSKGWSSVEASKDAAENLMMGISEEELYNLPTAEYVYKRGGFLNRQLTVYHAAFVACADLRNIEAMETLLDMLQKDGKAPDNFILMQIMRCYLRCGDLDRGKKTFDDYMNSGKPVAVELYVSLAEGAMLGHTPNGMKLALETLENMTARNFYLSPKMGTDLLLLAAGEKDGYYTTANYIWDLLRSRNAVPSFPAVEAYYKGLKERDIPAEDERIIHVTKTWEDLRRRFGPGRF
ncbi:pentatricopeptide repeat-containing protein At4g35850, mitochondrial [Impatiens glandulifera]|uniref:pentatricopeptide repeat-containing protein At4g35850, mitochondrial n=1 Tax=Impatiens glandulifera TaxID=253017 RepID=UPI001FB0B0E4|nr:pentatricopeptide repeat-containing protein At4g35850, mitochondrial [Impatiens glandulifera]